MSKGLTKSRLVINALAIAALISAQSATAADSTSREACRNQWLFNGVWRVEITNVEPFMNGNQQTGWQVTEVWRNGTAQELSPKDSALQGQRLELNSGDIAATDSTIGSLSQQGIVFNSFPPAGEFTYKQVFVGNSFDSSNTPKGLSITFNGAQLAQDKSKPQFSTSKYNFHFNLGCAATGAASQAEGGSTQLAAVPGCLNEWMSNGVWKMRVESISPYPPDARPQDQFQWRVTQTWVNISGRGIVPRNYEDQGGKFAPTNVTDEYLATQGGKSGSSANANGGFAIASRPGYDWAPGASYTFTQSFGWGSFDSADKPIRLLVTFDDKRQNAVPSLPHYRTPADFRIDLTCTK